MTSAFASGAVASALVIAIGLARPTVLVYAQQFNDTVGNATPSPQAAQSEGQELRETPQHLFGDWGGIRTYLGDHGIDLNLDFTTETAGNPTGGLRQGVDYAHQIGLQLDMDWQKLAGIPGFSTHLAMVERAGRNLSSDYIGDNVLQAQEIFGAGFDMAVHDVWFYAQQKLFDDRVDAVLGRVFPGMDFAASPLYCNFMTLTICGHPRALTAEQGFIDWPQNTWGGRVRVRPTADTYIMGGIYASQPFPSGGRSGFDWSADQVTGAFYTVELGWEPVFGPDHLSGHYKIGVGYDTSNFMSNAFVLMGPVPTVRGRTQFWITFDQMLFRNGTAPNNGLTLLAAYAHDDPENSLYQHFAWVGMLYSGFWRARPNDQIGFAFTYYQVSPLLSQKESLEQQFGLPPTYPYGVQGHGMVLEANYNFPIYRGVQLQPELQYFFRPGGVPSSSVPNAFVIGLKTHVLF
jgi:porin